MPGARGHGGVARALHGVEDDGGRRVGELVTELSSGNRGDGQGSLDIWWHGRVSWVTSANTRCSPKT
jgi:hypothetical protein